MKLSDERLAHWIEQLEPASKFASDKSPEVHAALTELQALRKWKKDVLPFVPHSIACEYYQDPPNGHCTCGLDDLRKAGE